MGVLLAQLLAAPVWAQESGAACAAIEDDGERLACYDRVFRDGGSAEAGEAIVLQSQRLIPAAPSGREPATLTISCAEGEMETRFAFAGQQVSVTGDIAPLTYQIDQGATTVRTLSASEDNRSLTFFSMRDTENFLDSLAGGTNLRVRVTPARQRSLTVDFRIEDVVAEIETLRRACGSAG